ncbi:fibronectin type III domain-containing protein [Salinimicrobium xinjiangense]|uniref:fibronectin type III domain-containing protein n=1 Tax=Salinimicrobium xinjiangense TaxID=438596 RepID=UPI0003FF47D2|nr:fibronectin type III domain-containing protein [Salinimicrobium xinjiangense]
MKIKWYLLNLSALLILAGCSKEETGSEPQPGPPKQVNMPPAVPVQVFPEDKSNCSARDLELRWEAAVDPEGDAVQYLLQISKYSNFSIMAHNRSTSALQERVGLERGVLYYWRIQAEDNAGKSDFSPVRTFYTEPNLSYNSVPFQPEQISPGNGASVETSVVLLEWSAVDPDGDNLRYDLYLGSEDPPQLFKTELTENLLEINIEPETQYFWKIVAKDNSGAEAVGQVWTFTTL